MIKLTSDTTCLRCPRKTECYPEDIAKSLIPDQTYKTIAGYDCGVCFRNYEEMREFIFIIGEAINKRSKYVKDSIMKDIAEQYGLPVYNVMLEFERIE